MRNTIRMFALAVLTMSIGQTAYAQDTASGAGAPSSAGTFGYGGRMVMGVPPTRPEIGLGAIGAAGTRPDAWVGGPTTGIGTRPEVWIGPLRPAANPLRWAVEVKAVPVRE